MLALYSVQGQNFTRQQVVLEVGAGFDYPLCAGVAMGLDELADNADAAAIMQHHINDTLENAYALARINYYGMDYFPTTIIDGVQSFTGGSPDESQYFPLLFRVNQRLDITSPVYLKHTLIENGDGTMNYDVLVNYPDGNESLRLFSVITESGLPFSWFGLEEVNHVSRKFVSGPEGIELDFSNNDSIYVNQIISLDDDLDIDQCRVITFVQNLETGEIHQAIKQKLTPVQIQTDVELLSIENPGYFVWYDTVIPVVKVKNNGWDTITSLDFTYEVNNKQRIAFTWEGNLPFEHNLNIVFPEIGFDLLDENSLTVNCNLVNGEEDENMDNNVLIDSFQKAEMIPNAYLLLHLMTDNYPQEAKVMILDENREIVYEIDTLTMENYLYTIELPFSETGNYIFRIEDSYGDGICCSHGNGYYQLTNSFFDVFYENDQFKIEDEVKFSVGSTESYFAYFTADRTNINVGDSVLFSNFCYGVDTLTQYLWTFEQGLPETDNTAHPTYIHYADTGSFDVRLVIQNGEFSDTLIKENLINVYEVGIIENNLLNLSVNPIPFHNFAELKFFVIENKTVKVALYNLGGTCVMEIFEGTPGVGEHVIGIRGEPLAVGTYLLVFQSENEQIVKKIVKI